MTIKELAFDLASKSGINMDEGLKVTAQLSDFVFADKDREIWRLLFINGRTRDMRKKRTGSPTVRTLARVSE